MKLADISFPPEWSQETRDAIMEMVQYLDDTVTALPIGTKHPFIVGSAFVINAVSAIKAIDMLPPGISKEMAELKALRQMHMLLDLVFDGWTVQEIADSDESKLH